MTYISSQSLSAPMRQAVLQAQAGLAQAQTEITTGQHADLGVALGARAGRSIALTNEADALGGYQTTNALAATRLDTTATALTSMIKTAQAMSATLIAANSAGGSTAGLQASGAAGLQGLLAGLNVSAGGQYVFGGINSGTTPMTGYAAGSAARTATDAAFQQAFGVSPTDDGASTITGAAMKTFLDTSFDTLFDDAGWSSNWSNASDVAISTRLAPSASATTSVSANATGFRQIAEAYTMLQAFGGTTVSADAKAAVVAKAGALVNAGIAALNAVQTDVGTSQAAITSADTSLGAQATLLKEQASNLDAVDPYALATRVSTLQTQLQASYQLTAQLQKLSLVNYISG